MGISMERFRVLRFAAGFSLAATLFAITAFPQSGDTQRFTVPDDIALRIRLDDTLTSTDSQVGDPSARPWLKGASTRAHGCTAISRKLICLERSKVTPA